MLFDSRALMNGGYRIAASELPFSGGCDDLGHRRVQFNCIATLGIVISQQ